jgi:hypothetical protein
MHLQDVVRRRAGRQSTGSRSSKQEEQGREHPVRPGVRLRLASVFQPKARRRCAWTRRRDERVAPQNTGVERNPVFFRLVYRQRPRAVSRPKFGNLPAQGHLQAGADPGSGLQGHDPERQPKSDELQCIVMNSTYYSI